jgi:hypothetical protein
VADKEVWKRISNPFRREIEIVEWIRNFEYGEKEERSEDEFSERGVSRWAAGIGRTKVEPRPDGDERKDKPEYIEREFA